MKTIKRRAILSINRPHMLIFVNYSNLFGPKYPFFLAFKLKLSNYNHLNNFSVCYIFLLFCCSPLNSIAACKMVTFPWCFADKYFTTAVPMFPELPVTKTTGFDILDVTNQILFCYWYNIVNEGCENDPGKDTYLLQLQNELWEWPALETNPCSVCSTSSR